LQAAAAAKEADEKQLADRKAEEERLQAAVAAKEAPTQAEEEQIATGKLQAEKAQENILAAGQADEEHLQAIVVAQGSEEKFLVAAAECLQAVAAAQKAGLEAVRPEEEVEGQEEEEDSEEESDSRRALEVSKSAQKYRLAVAARAAQESRRLAAQVVEISKGELLTPEVVLDVENEPPAYEAVQTEAVPKKSLRERTPGASDNVGEASQALENAHKEDLGQAWEKAAEVHDNLVEDMQGGSRVLPSEISEVVVKHGESESQDRFEVGYPAQDQANSTQSGAILPAGQATDSEPCSPLRRFAASAPIPAGSLRSALGARRGAPPRAPLRKQLFQDEPVSGGILRGGFPPKPSRQGLRSPASPASPEPRHGRTVAEKSSTPWKEFVSNEPASMFLGLEDSRSRELGGNLDYPECGRVPLMSLLPAYAIRGSKRPMRPSSQAASVEPELPATRAGSSTSSTSRRDRGSRSRSTSRAGDDVDSAASTCVRLPPVVTPAAGIMGKKAPPSVATVLDTSVVSSSGGLRAWRRPRAGAPRDPVW